MTSKNAIRCVECGKVLESKHRHDFVSCGCPNNTFVDGGGDYRRMGGKLLSRIEVYDVKTNTFVPLPVNPTKPA